MAKKTKAPRMTALAHRVLAIVCDSEKSLRRGQMYKALIGDGGGAVTRAEFECAFEILIARDYIYKTTRTRNARTRAA
jgi:hypothetical protein